MLQDCKSLFVREIAISVSQQFMDQIWFHQDFQVKLVYLVHKSFFCGQHKLQTFSLLVQFPENGLV